MTYHTGDICFVRHPKHSWVVGNVSGGSPNNWSVKTNDTERQCVGEMLDRIPESQIATCREDLLDEQTHDLLQLTVLHDATLLRCLYLRYFQDIVYTNIGAIVVALNPFNFKIPRYMDDKMQDYLKEGQVIEKNVPHSWAQAHNTYNEMAADNANQCILISGESGAGKTEATKIVMKYLAAISCSRGSAAEKAQGMAVGEKLNACSPILETFGNAKTVRNDNSSRFGKFMKVKFSPTGQLVGAETTKYLLEKSRIVTCAENERVYHSFYLVTRGSMASKFGVQNESVYKSINAGKCPQNSEYNTAEDFALVAGSMTKIGLSADEISSTWAVTAGILSILNVTFAPDGESSKVEPASKQFLESSVNLWKIQMDDIIREFSKTELRVPGSAAVWKDLNPPKAYDVRDALAKALYDGLFTWLVNKSNELCDVNTSVGNWIGLLDIFGFEDFVKNSFEQLCINLANETLQNHYNRYIFEKDMEECRAEGIDVTAVVCPDNTPCLRLITDRGGILALLDEECVLGKGTDFGFLEKVAQAHEKNKFFEKKKTSRDQFIVKHYAASVTYDVNGWREKNADTLKDNVKTMMRSSKDPLTATLLEAPIPPDQLQRAKRYTVGGFFNVQVQELMKVIESTNPHWIRCIKPHPAKKPRQFDGVQTMNQLESSGVLGTVKIRKAGYPIRTVFEKFVVRYRIIGGSRVQGKAPRDACTLLLEACDMNTKAMAQVGRTKVFMKSEAFPMIERKRNECLLGYVLKMQRSGRGFFQRKKANKDLAAFKQKRLIAMLVDEYRLYMKRSAEIREIRARLRKEAEEKYRHLRQDVEVQSATARAHLFDEMAQQAQQMFALLQRLLQVERERLERVRAAREALFRAESAARVRLFEEGCRYVDELSDTYDYEVAVVREMELVYLQEREESTRTVVIDEERTARNRFWRSFQSMRSAQAMEILANATMLARHRIEQAESLCRLEMQERMPISRSGVVVGNMMRKQARKDQAAAQERYIQRLVDEKRSNKKLHTLDALWRDEVLRVREESLAHQESVARAGGFSTPGRTPTYVRAVSETVDQALWANLDDKLGTPAVAASPPTTGAYAAEPAVPHTTQPSIVRNTTSSVPTHLTPHAVPSMQGFSPVPSVASRQSGYRDNNTHWLGGDQLRQPSSIAYSTTPSATVSQAFRNPMVSASPYLQSPQSVTSVAARLTETPLQQFSPVRGSQGSVGHYQPTSFATLSPQATPLRMAPASPQQQQYQSSPPGVRRKVWGSSPQL